MDHLCKEVIKYQGPYMSNRYNKFFNPNICHVCKLRGNGNFISCDKCCLVSYCTEFHKIMHYVEHIKACTVISNFLIKIKLRETDKFTTWQEWIQSRKRLLTLVQNEFDYLLKPYVKEMILWSKTCLICHQQVKLRVCEKCLCINYCDDHANEFRVIHTTDECNRLTILLNIEIEMISREVIEIKYNSFSDTRIQTPLKNIYEFFVDYIQNSQSNVYWTAADYVIMDYLSEPLTTYSGLERTNLLSVLGGTEHTIHVIGAESARTMDETGVKAWKLLFHLLPKISTLTIVFIGPKLKFAHGTILCCHHCEIKHKKLSFIFLPILYHEYTLATLGYKTPSIIVGFEVELKKDSTWMKSIKIIRTRNVPLIMSFSDKQKVKENIRTIQKLLRNYIEPTFNHENNFGGVAPHRNLETGDTYKRNQYLIIYKNLYPLDEN